MTVAAVVFGYVCAAFRAVAANVCNNYVMYVKSRMGQIGQDRIRIEYINLRMKFCSRGFILVFLVNNT